MSELLPVFIATLVLAGFSEKRSVRNSKNGDYLKKDKFFYIIMVVILAVFVGLRQAYNDTYFYRHAYEIMPNDFTEMDWSIGANPGFNLLNRCLKIIGFSTQSFLMFYAVVTITIYLWFIWKYSENIWLSVFLFMVTECYTFSMAAIKQCVAVAFCMLATDCAIRKKWISFIFWVLLACTFHPYSFMYLVLPFLKFKPFTIGTYWMLGVFAIFGIGLESLLGTLINITSMMGEGYTVEEFSGDGVNVFRLLVVWVPVVLAFIVRKQLRNSDNQKANLLLNITFLRAEIMFIALFGTANYFARLSNYFCMFQVITLPWLFRYFNKRSRRFLIVAMVSCYLAYFYYSQGILYGGFDQLFRRITLFQFFQMV